DLATTLLLATDKPVLVAPPMNVRMWQHAATRRNVAWLRQARVRVMEPDEGAMACGEYGPGRPSVPQGILLEISVLPHTGADPLAGHPEFDARPEPRLLYGKHVLVTAGRTREPIDPVRYVANPSRGKQGYAIAAAAAAAGACVT